MTFLWPLALVGLAMLPLAVVAFVRFDRTRRARRAALGASVGVATTSPRRRFVAPVVLLLALATLLVGIARPSAEVDVPRFSGRVILAFDTSASMAATDVELGDATDDKTGTRLELAKQTARDFVIDAPDDLEIGVVSFSSAGLVTMRPTAVRNDVLAAIDRLQPVGETALSQGLLAAIDAGADAPITFEPGALEEGALPPLDVDDFGSAVIVMMSDGEDTTETDPLIFAELASTVGLRVDTVGIGTVDGSVLELDGFNLSTALVEEPLQAIAATTNGTYQRAETPVDLTQVYDSVERALRIEPDEIELTALFALAGLLLAFVAASVGIVREGRIL